MIQITLTQKQTEYLLELLDTHFGESIEEFSEINSCKENLISLAYRSQESVDEIVNLYIEDIKILQVFEEASKEFNTNNLTSDEHIKTLQEIASRNFFKE